MTRLNAFLSEDGAWPARMQQLVVQHAFFCDSPLFRISTILHVCSQTSKERCLPGLTVLSRK